MAHELTLLNLERSKITISVGDASEIVLRIEGHINEDVNLTTVLAQVAEFVKTKNPFAFDLSKVARVNSCGVREWIMFLERLQAAVSVRFLKVNEVWIEQASVVPSILGKKGTPIEEISAPYFCASCGTNESRAFLAADVKIENGQGMAPEANCSKCGTAMEFDATESKFFSFVKRL